MGYEDLVRAGVQIASQQFESMKVDVTHTPWIASDGKGKDAFGSPVTRRALVEWGGRRGGGRIEFTPSGRLVRVMATVTFLEPIAANGAAHRQEPIDDRDIIMLPGNQTAPVVHINGFVDSKTDFPFAFEVTLGTIVRAQ